MQDQLAVTLPISGGCLRPWRVLDAAAYVAMRDEEVLRWTTERRDLTVDETAAAIQRVNSSDDVISWAIWDDTEGDPNAMPLGNIALVHDAATQVAEVMYFLRPDGRGRGLATGAVRAVCAWAFANLNVTRITLQTRPGNIRSQRVAVRAGFASMARAGAEVDNEREEAEWFSLSRGGHE